MYEVKEPSADNLRAILEETLPELEEHHGVKISQSALEAAALLTEKYKLSELRAQPDAAITVLDQTLTDFCRRAHSQAPEVEELTKEIAALDAAIQRQSKESPGLVQADIAAQRESLTERFRAAEERWNARQLQVRALYREMSNGEEEIRRLEDELELIREDQLNKARAVEQSAENVSQGQSAQGEIGAFAQLMVSSNLDTPQTAEIKAKINKLDQLVKLATDKYKTAVAEINAGLVVDENAVLRSFSALSGIPVSELNEEERTKLRSLEETLCQRVIGQEEPTRELAKAVKRARIGLKMPNKPSGTFIFLGPSGVGKTELAKALSEALSVPLLRFDMSEYMEKHAVAKLIGAPPGYEGYEHGGILTNAARRNPYCVLLFDEIEKAHNDVFNVMLQLLDDARLTDSRGLTASFKDAVVIMTTNVGTTHFLDEEISFAEAKELAMSALREQYRPEFLGRFGGNIYCFQCLSHEVLFAIARKDLKRVNSLIAGENISLNMQDDDLRAMIADKYSPREGARSILGYIDRQITSAIADLILSDSPEGGEINIGYDKQRSGVVLTTAPRNSVNMKPSK